MGVGVLFHGNKVPDLGMALEIAMVGAMPCGPDTKAGEMLDLAGVPAVVTRKISRAEFLRMIDAAGLSVKDFSKCPDDFTFWLISTD